MSFRDLRTQKKKGHQQKRSSVCETRPYPALPRPVRVLGPDWLQPPVQDLAGVLSKPPNGYYAVSTAHTPQQQQGFALTAMPLASVPKDAAEGRVLGTVLVLVSLT